MDPVTSGLLGFVGGSGIVTFILWLCKSYLDKWLGARFNEQLEEYKGRQARELERLKLRINSEFDRVTKLNQKEFEVLPEIWRKLCLLFNQVELLNVDFHRVPDFQNMNDSQIDKFLTNEGFSDASKETILESANRQEAYGYAYNVKKLNTSIDLFNGFFETFQSSGVFIEPSLRDNLTRFSHDLKRVVVEKQMDIQSNVRPVPSEATTWFFSSGRAELEELQVEVAGRLRARDLSVLDPAHQSSGGAVLSNGH